MFWQKRIIFMFCSRELKAIVHNRANSLGFDIPEYFKYIAAKDISECEAFLNNYLVEK